MTLKEFVKTKGEIKKLVGIDNEEPTEFYHSGTKMKIGDDYFRALLSIDTDEYNTDAYTIITAKIPECYDLYELVREIPGSLPIVKENEQPKQLTLKEFNEIKGGVGTLDEIINFSYYHDGTVAKVGDKYMYALIEIKKENVTKDYKVIQLKVPECYDLYELVEDKGTTIPVVKEIDVYNEDCDCYKDEEELEQECLCPYCRINDLEDELDYWTDKYYELKEENDKLKEENEHVTWQRDYGRETIEFCSNVIDKRDKYKTTITIGDQGVAITNEVGDLYPNNVVVEDKRKLKVVDK